MTSETKQYWKVALPAVLAVNLAGSLFSFIGNSGFSNGWFAALAMPSFMPPGWVFGAVWTTLYTLMGLALAMVWVAPQSRERNMAIGLFFVQLAVNLSWSPIFFGAHMIEIGLLVILLLFVLVGATAWHFHRVRPLAGLLLIPYLAWLCLAAALDFETGRLNPGADSTPLGLVIGD